MPQVHKIANISSMISIFIFSIFLVFSTVSKLEAQSDLLSRSWNKELCSVILLFMLSIDLVRMSRNTMPNTANVSLMQTEKNLNLLFSPLFYSPMILVGSEPPLTKNMKLIKFKLKSEISTV